MKNKRHIFYLSTAIVVSLVSAHIIAQRSLVDLVQAESSNDDLRSMTPDQLESSLQPDKRDAELDAQLKLDTEIDAKIQTELAQQAQKLSLAANPVSASQPEPIKEMTEPDAYELLVQQNSLPLELTPQPTAPKKTATKKTKKKTDDGEAAYIEFHFEDADLENFLKYIEDVFDVTFITNDLLTPAPKTGKGPKGSKISFKTHNPLTKKEAWNLFISLLDLAGLTLVPEGDPKVYKVIQTEAARKAPVPVYIGVKPETLPNNDQIIRFVYFVENANLKTIDDIVQALRSTSSAFLVLNELNAFILTDKAYNITSLMKIVTELDRTSLPQAMSVLKLRRADALEVKKLYDSIIQTDDASIATRLFPARKQPTTLYFPENTRLIAEPRSNSLILLGPQDSIKKIEDFIVNYVDVDLGKLHSPLRTYQLKYADANTVAGIMNDITRFGRETVAGQVGGVRDEDKYLKAMTFTPEPATNTLIIRGEEEDFLRAKEIIVALDEAQPQIAMEVLILSVDMAENKSLGTQLRSKVPGIEGLVGPNVKFQESGSFVSGTAAGMVTDGPPGVNNLLGNLVTLATSAIPGNTVVSLGTDQFGIWGIFNILHTISNAEIISNPFIVTTNKKKARVAVGELRRVVTGQTIGGGSTPFNSFGNQPANLSVDVTPQINSDGMIILDLDVNLDVFTDATDPSSATKLTKQVKTTTIVADKEVLALGGLVQNKINNNLNKIPILGNIPIIGWLFKNKQKTDAKSNLLILISTRIIRPEAQQSLTTFTQDRLGEYYDDLDLMVDRPDRRDPVHRAFFADKAGTSDKIIDDYIFDRHKKRSKKKTKKIELTKNNTPTDATKMPTAVPPKQEIVIAVNETPPAPTVAQMNMHKGQSGKRPSMLDAVHERGAAA